MKAEISHSTRMKKYLLIVLLFALAACQGPPPPPGVKIGKPYSVGGKTYRPEYDPTYDETGLASWYGPGFHGSSTANGETFNTHDLTAAHPTLPLPSLVRVTNLENGKTQVVRINDRGPFARGRIIDLSKASAQKLGVKGLSKVRVQYLQRESDEYVAAVKEGRRIDMFAFNDRLEAEKNASILAATAPSDQSFIIESSQNQTAPGDAVVNAAPVVSVSDDDLPVPQEKPAKKSRGIFISDAVADESMSKVGTPVVLRSPTLQPAEQEDTNQVEVTEKSVPANQPVKSSGRGMMIQVGSFSQQANAEKMRHAIAAVSPSNITMVEVAGHQWWRVQAGPFADNDKALEALDAIRANGAPDARIIRQ